MASDAVTLIVPAARLYRQSDIEEIRFSFGVPRKKTFKTTLKPIR